MFVISVTAPIGPCMRLIHLPDLTHRQYEQTRESVIVSRVERGYRVGVRNNITRALTALDLTTVNDIQQTSAALAQCTVGRGTSLKRHRKVRTAGQKVNKCPFLCAFQAVSREFICEECQNSTLNKLESMLEILQTDTKQGTVTPTEIADNILNIMGKERASISVRLLASSRGSKSCLV